MKLSLQTDFALRTLMLLAAWQRRVTVAEIARYFGISQAHVARVVNLLARHGFIRSIRGVGGGIELRRSADSITIGEVIAAFEGNLHLLDCVGGDGFCVIESFCKLRGVLRQAERVQWDYLNSVTLQDVLPTPRQLQRVRRSDSS